MWQQKAEQSLRKKFKKSNLVQIYQSDQYSMSLSNRETGLRSAFPVEKILCLWQSCFQELKRHNKFDFEVKFLVMDPGYSPANRQVIEENARRLQYPDHRFLNRIFLNPYTILKNHHVICVRG